MPERDEPVRLTPADYMTIANGVCGFLAVVLLLRRWADDPGELANGIQTPELTLAGALLLAGTVFDVLDGAVARATGSSGLGDHLDLMSDTITFGIVPAVLLAADASTAGEPWGGLIVAAAAAHVVATVIRLARHGAADPTAEDGFHGVTSPVGAAGVLAVVALGAPAPVTIVLVLALGVLMLGRFRYPHQSHPAALTVLVTMWAAASAGLAGLIPLQLVAGVGLGVIVAIPVVMELRPTRRPARPSRPRRRRSPASA